MTILQYIFRFMAYYPYILVNIDRMFVRKTVVITYWPTATE